MTTQYWLVKQEPDAYSWDNFVADKKTGWEGVRNFQARNNLQAMKRGDRVFFYASGEAKAVIGLAEVTKPAFPDPTAEPGESWVSVELKAGKPLPRPVSLAEIKAHPTLVNMALVKQSRLSVVPVKAEEFQQILLLAGVKD